MSETTRKPQLILGLAGAAVGGLLGYIAFSWMLRQGFYALVLPPGLLGLGAGITSRGRSMPLAIVCGCAGLALGLYTEWHFFPFARDETLSYFLLHLPNLRGLTQLMLVVGTVVSFRLALGLDQKSTS